MYFDWYRQVGRISQSGHIQRSHLEAADLVQGLVSGPRGVIWFTTHDGGVYRIQPRGGGLRRVASLKAGSLPAGIAAGRDHALWIAEGGRGRIARVTTSGHVREYRVGSRTEPYSIVSGPDRALWFTELLAGRIGRISLKGKVTQYRVPVSFSRPFQITVGPDRALWFAQDGVPRLGRISVKGRITEVGTLKAPATGITEGPDRAVWFVESSGNRYGRVTARGRVTEFRWTAKGERYPQYMAPGPGRTLWFRELFNPGMGRIVGLRG
jgi:virginiamycin B lyase